MMKNRKAQLISTYLFMLFGVSLMFYLGGYKPLFFTTLESTVGSSSGIGTTILTNTLSVFTNPLFLTLIGVASISAILLGGANFMGIFIFPIVFFLVVFANMVILPSSIFFDQSLPFIIRAVIGLFMNLLLAIAMANFFKGGQA